jgi:hypothetical protein
MLRSIPTSWFSWDSRLVEDDVEVAFLDLSTIRDAASFELEGRRWEIRREGMLTGEWLLETGGQVMARATKTSAFRRSYEVVAENRRLDLAPTGFARRAYQLRHGDIVIGGMAPDGFFRRSADVAFPGDLHLATRIFLAFLVLVQWRRTARSRNS